MKTTKVLSVIMAFIILVIISGCSSEMAVKTNNEDEIKESTKSNIEMTEPETTTEFTEATTVLSTKDGITLENAPKIGDGDLGERDIETLIGGQEYYISPSSAAGALLVDGKPETITDENGEEIIKVMYFDTFEPIFEVDSVGTLNGITIAGKVDGVMLQDRAYMNALKEKYPDIHIGYDNEGLVGNVPAFSLDVENASMLNIILKEPVVETNEYGFGKFNGKIILNAKNIENSKFNSDFKQLLPCFTNVENSYLRLWSVGDRVSFNRPEGVENIFSDLRNCTVDVRLSLDGGISINNNAVLFGTGQNNKIRIDLINMSFTGRAIDIEMGGMLASEIEINPTNSSYNLCETTPNFNSRIVNKIADIKYIEDANLSYNFQTIDGDNCPVIIQAGTIFHDDGTGSSLIIVSEIKTGGSLEKITSDFLLNAPSDGSVYNLTE
jgi:PBP1b-binding outer membrane lipoprotein LpoB